MYRTRALASAIVCLLLGGVCASGASAATPFQPRVAGALGLVPVVNQAGYAIAQDVASGSATSVTYHGGSVMTGTVTVHTIFWAPPGYSFQAGYQSLVQQFFTDVAGDTSATGACTTSDCNAFTDLEQYGQETGVDQASPPGVTPGSYDIAYTTADDSITDSDSYPSSGQCASPLGVETCLTDAQVQAATDHEAPTMAGSRGLTNLWIVFLPQNVDEGINIDECGTDAFGGYHGELNLSGHGPTIYAVVVDPSIETEVDQGADPEGNPYAEPAISAAAHETVESITDPEGTGWVNSDGFEVADMCEAGPQTGTALGTATDGSPYNQVINGNKYLIQEMWSDDDKGCVQATTQTGNGLPLPQVNLTQFSP
jgi:hypothetical protein